MKNLLIIILTFPSFAFCQDIYEQQFINEFKVQKSFYVDEYSLSILDMAVELEQFLIDNSYITEVSQTEYYTLIERLLNNEIEVDDALKAKQILNAINLNTPSNQACILKCGNRVVDSNPDLPPNHQVRILTTNLSRLAAQDDMANLEIIRDIIFDLPPDEFNKIHYHLYPLVLIEGLMEQ